MNKTGSGIILLPANATRKRTVLLDRSDGKIEAFLTRDVCAGSVISYQKNIFNNMYFISEVNIEYIPLSLAFHDILFLHHVLELCYYFIPVGSCIEGLFEVFEWIYLHSDEILSDKVKKYAVAKLLVTLGLWPEKYKITTEKIYKLVRAPIDSIRLQDIDLANERELEQWLRFCILQHPCSSKLRTMAFLFQGIR